jgi:hypothetical protein
MKPGTIIVILFVLAAAVVVGVSQLMRSQPPAEFTVVVNPLAEDWLREAVTRFNDSQPVVSATQRIQFNITVMEDLSIWQTGAGFTPENHPAAWIPSSSTAVHYSERYHLLVPSLARTPLVWGGYSSRVNVATNQGALPLDWEVVQRVAASPNWASIGGQASWQFPKLAFPSANMTMSGLGVLFSAAADYADSASISGDATRTSGFRTWLQPVIESVPNFQTLGTDPAAAMARGPSNAEMALLPENLWLNNLRGLTDEAGDSFVFSYPAYQFVLDFPLAAWNAPLNEIEPLAVQALADWLALPAQQSAAVAKGLRPSAGEPDETAALFAAASAYGIVLEPDYGTAVQPPSRTEASALVQWFSTARR